MLEEVIIALLIVVIALIIYFNVNRSSEKEDFNIQSIKDVQVEIKEKIIERDTLDLESIEKATGIIPKGFRAPNFDIKPNDSWAFEELAKRFDYDSSYITDQPLKNILPSGRFEFKNNTLREFFIFSNSVPGTKFSFRTGGTYLRLFPSIITINNLRKTFQKCVVASWFNMI